MTQAEHLERIKAKCRELISAFPPCESVAGWHSTIAAIEGLQYMTPGMSQTETINAIIAAWPEDLL